MPTPSDATAPRAPSSSPRGSLEYILFNAPWDAVIGNSVDQRRRPLDPAVAAAGQQRYLEYLAQGLRSFARTHAGGRITPRVNLVEVVPEGLSRAELRRFLGEAVPELEIDVRIQGYPTVRAFVEAERGTPAELYRSPNRLHEATLLSILRDGKEPYVAFADPDVTFTAPGCVARAFAMLADRPQSWVAGFLEPSGAREGPAGPYRSRERLHSVAVFFKAEVMRSRFPFAEFLAPTPLEERLAILRDPAAAEHYRTHLTLDTFSVVTEWLRGNFPVDHILDLGRAGGRYAEGSMLTIVSDLLVHSKWMEEGARPSLERALAAAGIPYDSSRELASLVSRASP